MPNDELENPEDVVDSSSSTPEARWRHKKFDFVNDFIRGWFRVAGTCTRDSSTADTCIALDVLVFSELAALYYTDCITSTLLLRSLIQIFLSPPLNLGLQTPVPNPRSHVSLILFSTFLSLLLHIFGSRPAADERGYLHGLVLSDALESDKLTSGGTVAFSWIS